MDRNFVRAAKEHGPVAIPKFSPRDIAEAAALFRLKIAKGEISIRGESGQKKIQRLPGEISQHEFAQRIARERGLKTHQAQRLLQKGRVPFKSVRRVNAKLLLYVP